MGRIEAYDRQLAVDFVRDVKDGRAAIVIALGQGEPAALVPIGQ